MNLFINRGECLNKWHEEKQYQKELEALINTNNKLIKNEIDSDNKDDNLINYLEAENSDYQIVLNRIDQEIENIESALRSTTVNPCYYKGGDSDDPLLKHFNHDEKLREQISSFPVHNISIQAGYNINMTDALFSCIPDVILGYPYCA